jgi:7,8-dihydropterin-6-yl-methyl-4-(beta-D-ribofuranosyl)aminobenzene 5'-phosphate synthase
MDGSILVTGEVDRTTDFETGMPFHEARGEHGWEPDPLILDDQALVVDVRDVGLVVMTGCGHAGAVNICRHALRLTGTTRLATARRFHLSGPAFEPIIELTVTRFATVRTCLSRPTLGPVVQHRLAAELPGAFVPNAVERLRRFPVA